MSAQRTSSSRPRRLRADENRERREADAHATLEAEGWTLFDVGPDWKRCTRGDWKLAAESWSALLTFARRKDSSPW